MSQLNIHDLYESARRKELKKFETFHFEQQNRSHCSTPRQSLVSHFWTRQQPPNLRKLHCHYVWQPQQRPFSSNDRWLCQDHCLVQRGLFCILKLGHLFFDEVFWQGQGWRRRRIWPKGWNGWWPRSTKYAWRDVRCWRTWKGVGWWSSIWAVYG